jgi:hypothetical protein
LEAKSSSRESALPAGSLKISGLPPVSDSASVTPGDAYPSRAGEAEGKAPPRLSSAGPPALWCVWLGPTSLEQAARRSPA